MDATKSVSKPTNGNGRIAWPKSPSIKQIFDFPDSIIYYISKNPSTPKAYLKMVKSCKLFFEKNPILIVARIHDEGSKVCSRNSLECHYSQKCCVKIDINKLSNKIWLMIEMDFSKNFVLNLAAKYVSKFFRCDNARFWLYRNEITLKDFQLIASKFQKFYFYRSNILNNDRNNVVMLEEILESIPVIKEFNYSFCDTKPTATTSTMKNINKLSNLGNLQKILLLDIPETINIEEFGKFIQDHKDTKIYLSFNENITEKYKNQLDRLINEIIASGVPNCLIFYPGQNHEKCKIMKSRYTF